MTDYSARQIVEPDALLHLELGLLYEKLGSAENLEKAHQSLDRLFRMAR